MGASFPLGKQESDIQASQTLKLVPRAWRRYDHISARDHAVGVEN